MTDNETDSVGESATDAWLAGGGPATGTRPVLAINPQHDHTFVAAAEALLDDGVCSLTGFQDALRGHFPDAFVRARDLSGELGTVWYVFRDGHWVNGRTDRGPGSDG